MSQEGQLQALFRAIAIGDASTAKRALALSPALATLHAETGASRTAAGSFFFEEIAHYAYSGDTALHIAAAAYSVGIAQALISAGASARAMNRRGAEPLHYCADGIPGSAHWNPEAQVAVAKLLLEAGADPNAADRDGTTPLHRAVRTRCAGVVRLLLANGADVQIRNKAGSSALHLAVQDTGRGGSGSPEAREQQARIIELLLDHGARASDTDAKGKSVSESAKSPWICDLLQRTR